MDAQFNFEVFIAYRSALIFDSVKRHIFSPTRFLESLCASEPIGTLSKNLFEIKERVMKGLCDQGICDLCLKNIFKLSNEINGRVVKLHLYTVCHLLLSIFSDTFLTFFKKLIACGSNRITL